MKNDSVMSPTWINPPAPAANKQPGVMPYAEQQSAPPTEQEQGMSRMMRRGKGKKAPFQAMVPASPMLFDAMINLRRQQFGRPQMDQDEG